MHESVLASASSKCHFVFMSRAESQSVQPGAQAEELKRLRRDLSLNRSTFGRLLGCSERGLANWEAGRPIQSVYSSRLRELQNLLDEISKIVGRERIGSWLSKPSDDFAGMKPIELIERGESAQLWRWLLAHEKPAKRSGTR